MQQPPQPQPVVQPQPQQSSTIVVVTAIYFIIISVANVCLGIALGTGGALLGSLGLGSAAVLQQAAEESTEITEEGAQAVQEATNALGNAAAAGGLLTVVGIVGLIIGIIAFVVAIGLFMKQPWSWIGTVIVTVSIIALAVIQLVASGFNLGISAPYLIPAIINLVILYLFWTNDNVKRVLGRA